MKIISLSCYIPGQKIELYLSSVNTPFHNLLTTMSNDQRSDSHE